MVRERERERVRGLIFLRRTVRVVALIFTSSRTVRLNVDVQSVSHAAPGKCTVTLANGTREHFDRVVVACSADAAQALLTRDAAGLILSLLLRCVSYVDDDWGRGFVTGVMHTDAPAVLDTTEAIRCTETHSNYVTGEFRGHECV